MYLSQSKNKNGILIVDKLNRYFVSWEDLDLLKKGQKEFKGKPIIVISPLKPKEEIQQELK